MIAALLLLSLGTLRAAEVQLAVSTTSAVLGESVQAAAKLASGEALALDLEKSATDTFAIENVRDEAGGLRFEVRPLALGSVAIPLFFTVGKAGGPRASLAAPPLTLEVALPGPPGQPPQLLDIKEPRAAARALWPWLLAALLAAAAWLLYKNRRAAPETLTPPEPVDDRPPEVIALAELAELERSPLWTEGRFKEYYWRLSELLRRYLERRYGMPATKLTTAELYRQLRQAELDRQIVVLFKDIFDRGDLVKFSKIAPEPDWGARDAAGARQLVEHTTPKDMAPKEAAR